MRTAKKVLLLFFASALAAFAEAQEIPHLLTVPQISGKRSQSGRIIGNEQIALDAKTLGFSVLKLDIQGEELVAERIASERHAHSEMFLYRVEGEDLYSVFTRSYVGEVLGYIAARGKSYFVSSEENQYSMAERFSPASEERVRYPLLEGDLPAFSSTGFGSGKHRGVRSAPSPPTVFVIIAICSDYRDAVGGIDKAILRAEHMIDRQNAAYLSSHFNGKIELKEIIFVDPPQEVIQRDLYLWAVAPESPVRVARARNKAGASIVLSLGATLNEAPRTPPSPVDPDLEVAIVSGFFASWDDGDVSNFIHEMGHLSGGGHNPESEHSLSTDPQASARDWYSCEESIYGALSYNVCDKWLQKIEMYSGLNSVYAGKVRGSETQNNVGTFEKVFVFLAGEHN